MLHLVSNVQRIRAATILIFLISYHNNYEGTVNDKIQVGEKFCSFHGFSMNRECFVDECSVEQWLSLALSTELK